MKEASVLICESEFLSRTGLKTIINKNPFYRVDSEVENYEELEKLLNQKTFDVITLDFEYEGNFNLESISLIQELSPLSNILIISNEKNKRNIYDVLGRGINQYLTKNCREGEIYKALDACQKGQKYYCPRILDIIIDKTFGNGSKTGSKNGELTQREEEIVTLVAQGKMAKEIAGLLNISVHTIYTHRKNVMKKLKISSPVELITYAINNGLVEL